MIIVNQKCLMKAKKYQNTTKEKSLEVSDIILADTECLLEKNHSCQNNPKKTCTEKEAKHSPSGYLWFRCCSFDASKNEYGYYRGNDCMKKLCADFKDLAMKIINYKEKEMILLTDKETKSKEKQKVCYICKNEFSTDENDNTFKLYHKVRDHCHYTGNFRGATHICNLRYKTPKEIVTVIHNGSTYE